MIASITYKLKDNSHLDIEMSAATDRATVVNLSNHVYFNLAGHGSGWEGLQQHTLKIDADKFTPDDQDYLPTGCSRIVFYASRFSLFSGEILPVKGTEYDLQEEPTLAVAIPSARHGEGFCVNYSVGAKTGGIRYLVLLYFCLTYNILLSHVATLSLQANGRRLEVWSDQPGLELYTANFLPATGAGLQGKSGAEYCRWGAVCLMTQNYRDAANHPNIPTPVLRPGEHYRHRASYRFY